MDVTAAARLPGGAGAPLSRPTGTSAVDIGCRAECRWSVESDLKRLSRETVRTATRHET